MLFDTALDASHRAGNPIDLSAVLAELVVFFNRRAESETAATIYGTSSHYVNNAGWTKADLPAAVANLRGVLGDTLFDQYVAVGAAMEPADAVAYAREQIQTARRRLADVT
jgi:hypothetical protein